MKSCTIGNFWNKQQVDFQLQKSYNYLYCLHLIKSEFSGKSFKGTFQIPIKESFYKVNIQFQQSYNTCIVCI